MDLVWHRNDLRVTDNKAVSEAGADFNPVYIFDDRVWNSDKFCDARKEFVLQSLESLDRQYRHLGSSLSLKKGNPLQVLDNLDKTNIYFNKDANHFLQKEEKAYRKRFNGCSNSAVNHGEGYSRGNWQERTEKWFKNTLLKAPRDLTENNLESELTLEDAREVYSINPDKKQLWEGGVEAAEKKLGNFLKNIDNYSGCISPPAQAEKHTSHLSPHIRYGTLSVRKAYQRAEKLKDSADGRSIKMFQDRLVWQQHFNQKLEDNPDLFREAINPVYRDLHREKENEKRFEAWKNGLTGYPLVDASMRALKKTGWLNFRMRAMSASFHSYILKIWWKKGADHFYRHLMDADVAINYYQWQMQSGLLGVHANRIYNPIKQVEDNDPDGEFIRKYVPELENIPVKYLSKPWEMPENIQGETGIMIGKDYPEPIVNYEREAKKAREFFNRKAPEAYRAFENDEVWRKASLSSRHSRNKILSKAGESQKSLGDF